MCCMSVERPGVHALPRGAYAFRQCPWAIAWRGPVLAPLTAATAALPRCCGRAHPACYGVRRCGGGHDIGYVCCQTRHPPTRGRRSPAGKRYPPTDAAWRRRCRAPLRCLGNRRATAIINGAHPCQPIPPFAAFSLGVGTFHQESTERSLGESCGIHSRHGLTAFARGRPRADQLSQSPLDRWLIQPTPKAIPSGQIRLLRQPQGCAQLAVFSHPGCGFAKGPVLIAHQAPNGRQLGLRTPAFRKLAAGGRLRDLAHSQRDRCKCAYSHYYPRAYPVQKQGAR
jgi:hypothetical protein